MPHIEDVLLNALAQDGDNYVFNAAVDFNNPDPRDFDCSGLVAWACGHSKVQPALPHSAFMQAQMCIGRKTDISVAEGVATRGALLFKFPNVDNVMALTTRPEGAHVAWSLGNGSTIEAASSKWGVGMFTSDPVARKWTHAARIPGVDYAARPTDTTSNNDNEEDEVSKIMYFKGAGEGEAHPYVVTGGIGKHLTPEALNLQTFLKIEAHGSMTEPLDKAWQDSVAIVDGPLRNVNL